MKRILGVGAVALISVATLTGCGSASGSELADDVLKAVQENDADLIPEGAVCPENKIEDFEYAGYYYSFGDYEIEDFIDDAHDQWKDDANEADKVQKNESTTTRAAQKSKREDGDTVEHFSVSLIDEDGFAVANMQVNTTDALGDTCILSASFYAAN